MKKDITSNISKPQSLRTLMIDDSEDDVLLIIRGLNKGGYNPLYERVETAAAMKKALKEKQWDIILCDYKMPKFNAPSAISLLKETNIDIPVIIISGTIGEETAIECMRLGAHDYFMKGKLSRLCPAIARELEEAKVRNKQKETESQKNAALEELRQSEEKYRAIIENIQEGYFEIDLAGNFTFFYDSMCRCLGYSQTELMGMNYKKYTDKENAKKLFKTFNETYKTGITGHLFNYEIIRKDGTRRQLEGFLSLQKDSSGKPIIFRGTIRDITERKKAEDELRQSEEKYRTILENIEDGYYEVDLKGNFTFFNDSMCRILGYSKKELMGMNNRQITDKENAEIVFRAFNKVYNTGEPTKEFNWQVIGKNGTKRYIEQSASLKKDSSDKPTGFRGIIHDITERKKAEDALRKSEELYTRLVDAIPDIIVRTDLEGKILFVNDFTLKISGYKREEIEGWNMLAFISPENHEDVMKNLLLMMEGRLSPREYNLILKNRKKIPVEVNGDVLRNEDGTPFGIVNVCRDISERKQTERILRENEERLRGITKNLPGIIFQFYAKDSGKYGMSYVSERLGEFLGLTAKVDTAKVDTEKIETLFPLFISHIHEEDRDRFLTSIKTAVEKKTAWNFEGRVFVITSGEMIWFQGLATPTRHEDQLVFDGILLNITERKLAEKKSRQSEEKFHKIFMTTPDCIAITRMKDGLLVDANKGYEDIVGWKRENVIGIKSTDPRFNFWVDPSARNLMVADLKAGKDVLHREIEFRRSDGSVRTGVYSARSINIADEDCIILILQDITEQKLVYAELQRTLDSLRKAFGATIQVMVSAVEMRDPYTAGHQIRAADIARAIATEMGLAQEKIDGIRMAGTIHDIGKLSIPAEIL
ncbi:MAG: PAS domain S-box protein, partial [Deltaproteobacteria bacterium]|nr:PAS domain S-box protein [Deltaproteobacteria bacterium]